MPYFDLTSMTAGRWLAVSLECTQGALLSHPVAYCFKRRTLSWPTCDSFEFSATPWPWIVCDKMSLRFRQNLASPSTRVSPTQRAARRFCLGLGLVRGLCASLGRRNSLLILLLALQ